MKKGGSLEKTIANSKINLKIYNNDWFLVNRTLSNIKLGVIKEYGFIADIETDEEFDDLIIKHKHCVRVTDLHDEVCRSIELASNGTDPELKVNIDHKLT